MDGGAGGPGMDGWIDEREDWQTKRRLEKWEDRETEGDEWMCGRMCGWG